jgi:hypothetical protein
MPARLIPNAPPLPSIVTIGDLIDLADSVPAGEVISLMRRFFAKVEELASNRHNKELERHLIVLGTLVNRAIFEVYNLPKDRLANL